MSNVFKSLAPPYPVYDPQPMFGGRLPSIDEIGPPDMRPSGLNPYYTQYHGTRGRNFAGIGATKMDSADIGIKDYPNELDMLANADDVQGNGVFDPHGTQGNVHVDEGIFADHENIPGYIVRDMDYAPSQVIDGTTGQPVMYVPGGAVAIDQSQLDTYRERQLLWEVPPGMSPETVTHPTNDDNWIPEQYSYGIQGLGDEAPAPPVTEPPGSRVTMFLAFGVVGIAVGIAAATLMPRR